MITFDTQLKTAVFNNLIRKRSYVALLCALFNTLNWRCFVKILYNSLLVLVKRAHRLLSVQFSIRWRVVRNHNLFSELSYKLVLIFENPQSLPPWSLRFWKQHFQRDVLLPIEACYNFKLGKTIHPNLAIFIVKISTCCHKVASETFFSLLDGRQGKANQGSR